MESISDFWKSARERFTNPLAFAYLVAWFCYNWKITVAIFFTDSYPRQYQSVYDFISDEIVGFWVYAAPFLYAVGYVIVISFARQLVTLLNVWFDKLGTIWALNASKGGQVSVDKFLMLRDEVLEKRKRLDTLLRQQTAKDDTIANQIKQINQLQGRIAENQKQTTELQTNVNGLQSKINEQTQEINSGIKERAELPIVKKRLEEMERNYQEQLGFTNKMRDSRIFNGTWKVVRNGPNGAEEFSVEVIHGVYTAPEGASTMRGFFYDHRNGAFVFYRALGTTLQSMKFLTYELRFESQTHVVGKENEHPIQYTLIEPIYTDQS